MDHKRFLTPYQRLTAFLMLVGLAMGVQAQSTGPTSSEPKIIIRSEPITPQNEEATAAEAPDPALGEGKAGPTDCEQKFPMPASR
ncbi:MAG: hypothetical protein EBV46_07340, partial [Burkholderiaceae bacterium]|nr:hypothetical protein [Burkholderiaceae bacterium]